MPLRHRLPSPALPADTAEPRDPAEHLGTAPPKLPWGPTVKREQPALPDSPK